LSVYCENCEHLSEQGAPYRWTCMKHIRYEVNFLSKEKRINPPYKYCKDININGDCRDYTERKDNGV